MSRLERGFFVEPEALASLNREFDSAWIQLTSRLTFASEDARGAARREFARLMIGLYRETPESGTVSEAAVALFLCLYPTGDVTVSSGAAASPELPRCTT